MTQKILDQHVMVSPSHIQWFTNDTTKPTKSMLTMRYLLHYLCLPTHQTDQATKNITPNWIITLKDAAINSVSPYSKFSVNITMFKAHFSLFIHWEKNKEIKALNLSKAYLLCKSHGLVICCSSAIWHIFAYRGEKSFLLINVWSWHHLDEHQSLAITCMTVGILFNFCVKKCKKDMCRWDN